MVQDELHIHDNILHGASRIEQLQITERRRLGTKEKRVIFISCVKVPFYPTFISTSRGII